MHSLKSLILDAGSALEIAGIENPVREAYLLMGFALDREMAFLRGHPEFMPNNSEVSRFEDAVDRRSKHVPFQHIVGSQEFFGLDFEVTPDVLVPRPETELLVETAIAFYKDSAHLSICEIGAGSGCIAISLLKLLPAATVVAVDISAAAIAVARRNADKHNVLSRLDFVVSDCFAALQNKGSFDLIVSNPPYIPFADIDGLQPEVRDHDPLIALTDKHDGLSITRRICKEAPVYLRGGGRLLLEIGIGQADEVLEFFDPTLWADVTIEQDLQSISRIVAAELGHKKTD